MHDLQNTILGENKILSAQLQILKMDMTLIIFGLVVLGYQWLCTKFGDFEGTVILFKIYFLSNLDTFAECINIFL